MFTRVPWGWSFKWSECVEESLMHSKVSEGLVVAITSAVTKSKVNKNSQREMGPTTDPSLVVTKGRGLGPGGGVVDRAGRNR